MRVKPPFLEDFRRDVFHDSRSDYSSRAGQRGLHACNLPVSKHYHNAIVDIVHVVDEHVAVGTVTARDVWKLRRIIVWKLRLGRIGHMIRARTVAGVAPDMVEVEPMPDFMRCRAA